MVFKRLKDFSQTELDGRGGDVIRLEVAAAYLVIGVGFDSVPFIPGDVKAFVGAKLFSALLLFTGSLIIVTTPWIQLRLVGSRQTRLPTRPVGGATVGGAFGALGLLLVGSIAINNAGDSISLLFAGLISLGVGPLFLLGKNPLARLSKTIRRSKERGVLEMTFNLLVAMAVVLSAVFGAMGYISQNSPDISPTEPIPPETIPSNSNTTAFTLTLSSPEGRERSIAQL